ILVAERRNGLRRIGTDECRRQIASQRRNRRVGQPHDSRPQQRGRAKVRKRIGEVAQNGEGVLNFVGVEEAEAFVDVRGNAASLRVDADSRAIASKTSLTNERISGAARKLTVIAWRG